ncbi:MAG TPA: hypothetical protein VHX16_06045 [Chloroflexota bacterium]|nr:hypothetical protein [Chloroflexota bacterium]
MLGGGVVDVELSLELVEAAGLLSVAVFPDSPFSDDFAPSPFVPAAALRLSVL